MSHRGESLRKAIDREPARGSNPPSPHPPSTAYGRQNRSRPPDRRTAQPDRWWACSALPCRRRTGTSVAARLSWV